MTADLPAACVRLLKLQHGAIARWQAPAVRLDLATIDAMLRRGRWQRLYQGVYATFTGRPPRECLLWAGVLRAGPGAMLSHYTAAELDGLTQYDPYGLVVELDGRADHLVEDRWRDIHRDNSNARAGKVTLRFSYADVTSRNCEVAADVCGTLRLRGWTGLPRHCGPSCRLEAS
jgi:hypothetical protein